MDDELDAITPAGGSGPDVAKLGMEKPWCTLHYFEQNYIIYMVKMELTTRNLILTMVHVHQAKILWLRPCSQCQQ